MLKIILFVLIILDAHKNCYGNLARKDEWKQQVHRLRRNYSSQSQNENPDQKGNSQNPRSLNYPVFGTTLKPRVRIYFDYPIEANKSENVNKQIHIPILSRSRNGQKQNSENLSYIDSSSEQNIQVPYSLTNQKRQSKSLKNNNKGNSVASVENSEKSQYSLDSDSQNSFEIYHLQDVERQSFGKRINRDYRGFYNQNHQNENELRLKNSQNMFGRGTNQKPKSLLSFRSRNSQNGQYIHPSRSGYGQKHSQISLKTGLGQSLQNFLKSQNVFESNCNATSNTIFIRKPGSKSVNVKGQKPFKATDYLPPVDITSKIYKGQEYLPPKTNKISLSPSKNTQVCCNNGRPSITTFNTTIRPFNTTTTSRRYYTIDTITKRPFYSTVISTTRTTNTPTISKKPYYIPIDTQSPKTTKLPYCHTCASTSGPFYIPVTKPPTAIPKVPPISNRPGEPTTEEDVLKNMTTAETTSTSRPVERGDVPDYDDITTPRQGDVGPAMAMPVPPELDEPIPTTTMSPAKTTSRIPSSTTTTNTTPLKSPNTTILMIAETTEYNRHLIQEQSSSTLAINTTTRTTSKPFTAPTYLPPNDPKRKMPALNTTPSDVAPAMAMPVPPEPEEHNIPIPPSTPSTTIITTSPSTTSTTTTLLTNRTSQTISTPNNNRNLLVESESTTTITEITATTAFKAPEYLPPKDPTRKIPAVNSTASDPGPARAIPVPPEPKNPNPMPPSLPTTTTMTIPPSTTSTYTSMSINRTVQTMSTDSNRHLIEESTETPKIQTTTPMPYRGPQYLPPKDPTRKIPVKTNLSESVPAMAMLVPPEPEEMSPSPPTLMTPIDTYRGADSPTSNTATLSHDMKPFKAPEYLPPQTAPKFPPSPTTAMPVTSAECSLDSNDVPHIDQRSFVNPCLAEA